MNNSPTKYFGIALDPIHIGAGGYRLGGVDNIIVREPATDVPKIPGTSLAGVIREYATIYKMENEKECIDKKTYKEKRDCAEQKIKLIFGDEIQQGMLRFFDGQIILFPVSSIQGTVWITTKDLIEDWLGGLKDKNGNKLTIPKEANDNAYAIKGIDNSKPLNLGWLLLEMKNVTDGKDILIPSQLNSFIKKIVIVSDKLFSHLVNDNLEVRTSVRIDPTTGTAEKGKLFTYEAIPRGTIFGFEIVIDTRKSNESQIQEIFSLIDETTPYLKLLGLGGLGTRGFGRVEIFKLNGNESELQSGAK